MFKKIIAITKKIIASTVEAAKELKSKNLKSTTFAFMILKVDKAIKIKEVEIEIMKK